MPSGITSLVFITTMLSAPISSPAKGDSGRARATEVEVEVVEQNGARISRFSFVVALRGEVETWISTAPDARHCKIRSEPRHSSVHIDLHRHGNQDNRHELHVVATRGLRLQKRIVLAEIRQAGGAKSQIFATLHSWVGRPAKRRTAP